MDTVAILAAISAILLAIELLVVVLIVGAIIYFIRRGIQAGRREASPYVQQAVGYVFQAEAVTKEYADLVVGAPLRLVALLDGLGLARGGTRQPQSERGANLDDPHPGLLVVGARSRRAV